MFYNLTLAVRDRIIQELRDYWSKHPRYEGLANNIQGKYSFDERPQFGMVVRTNGANNVVLSPNNFIGTVQGRVSLANVESLSRGSIEWVRETPDATPAVGVYLLKVFDSPDASKRGHEFQVYTQRYHREREDSLLFTSPKEIQLMNIPVEGSLRIIESPSDRLLTTNEYSLDIETGIVTLSEEVPRGLSLRALYTSEMETSGPFTVCPATAYRDIIQGATLAFGRRLQNGDQQAVIVTEAREDISQEYGGRWDVSVDIELIARDVHSQADLADQTVVWIWSSLRSKLTNLGMEISDVSLGGEAEEVYDDNGDDYFYTASISFSVQTDWFIHFPLLVPILSISSQKLSPVSLIPVTAPIVGVGNQNLVQRLL